MNGLLQARIAAFENMVEHERPVCRDAVPTSTSVKKLIAIFEGKTEVEGCDIDFHLPSNDNGFFQTAPSLLEEESEGENISFQDLDLGTCCQSPDQEPVIAKESQNANETEIQPNIAPSLRATVEESGNPSEIQPNIAPSFRAIVVESDNPTEIPTEIQPNIAPSFRAIVEESDNPTEIQPNIAPSLRATVEESDNPTEIQPNRAPSLRATVEESDNPFIFYINAPKSCIHGEQKNTKTRKKISAGLKIRRALNSFKFNNRSKASPLSKCDIYKSEKNCGTERHFSAASHEKFASQEMLPCEAADEGIPTHRTIGAEQKRGRPNSFKSKLISFLWGDKGEKSTSRPETSVRKQGIIKNSSDPIELNIPISSKRMVSTGETVSNIQLKILVTTTSENEE